MATVTKTFSFLADAEALADLGVSTQVAFLHELLDGDPLGCVKFVCTTGNGIFNETARQPAGTTWEDWGVPPGATVTEIEVTGWRYRPVASSRLTGGGLTVNVTRGGTSTVIGGTLVNANWSLTPSAVWSAGGGLFPARAVGPTDAPSDTQVSLELRCGYQMSSGGGPNADHRIDGIAVQITYTLLVTSGGSSTTGTEQTSTVAKGRNVISMSHIGTTGTCTVERGRICEEVTEGLAPDAIIALDNLSGTVGEVQDDPYSPDADWLDATNPLVGTEVRVGFPSPALSPSIGSPLQRFEVLVRPTFLLDVPPLLLPPTVDVQLYEGGVARGAAVTAAVSGATVVELDWNAGLLSDPTGAGVECRVVGHASILDTVGWTVEVGAVRWSAMSSACPNTSQTGTTGYSLLDPIERAASSIDSTGTTGTSSAERGVVASGASATGTTGSASTLVELLGSGTSTTGTTDSSVVERAPALSSGTDSTGTTATSSVGTPSILTAGTSQTGVSGTCVALRAVATAGRADGGTTGFSTALRGAVQRGCPVEPASPRGCATAPASTRGCEPEPATPRSC